jgi:hypothetical protein
VSFPLVDKQLGHYELLGGLGSGAMSEVYLARDTQLDRLVAVKVLSSQIVRRADGVQRFQREAQAAARLEHPNVATVFYSGTHEGNPYYGMELIRGWSFRELVESRVSFTLDQVLPLFAQACVGLEAAHRSGVTHRDIKPGNLMIAESGTLKVVDFGLAQLAEEDNRNKRRGIMGTPFYLAPEVINGEPGDHRSDLYSLGVTFWEILIGRPPFDGDTPHDVLRQHVHQQAPTLTERNPALSPGLAKLVDEMLAKDPDDRPQSFDEVQHRLRALTEQGTHLSRQLRWCSNQRMNTFVDGAKCSLCGRPYHQRIRPETFHVDLVGWTGPDAKTSAAEYIARALGHETSSIEPLLEPLPFRAAFRARRDRARRMHREFHELGVDVTLIPADDAESKGQLPIQRLPVTPSWPLGPGGSGVEAWPPLEPARPAPHREPQGLLVGALLLVVSTALAVFLFNSNAQIDELQAQLTTTKKKLTQLESQGAPDRDSPQTNPGEAEHSQASSLIFIEPGDFVAHPTRDQTRQTLAESTERLVSILPTLGSVIPLRVRLTQAPLWLPENPRVWDDASWAPVLEFPVSGITQVNSTITETASDNLTARALLRAAAGPSIPGWLLLGTAGFFERGSAAITQPEGNEEGPRSLSVRDVSAVPREATPFQEQLSRSFVSFLINRSGSEALDRVIKLLQDGRSPEEAVLRSFGASLEDLIEEWKALKDSGLAP